MNGLSIREVKIEDLEQVVDIQIRGWQTAYRGIISDSYLDSMNKKERLEKRKKDYNQNRFIVAVLNGKIVGFCRFVENNSFSTNINGVDSEIMALYVEPNLKRNGIGKALFEYVKKDLKCQNKKLMILWCLKENKLSRIFYEKMGGHIVGEKDFILENKTYKEVGYIYSL